MTQRNNLPSPTYFNSLTKRMLLGFGIGLITISFFVFGIDQTKPEWGKLWMIKPLIITPLFGAMAGAFYNFMDNLSKNSAFNRPLAIVLGLIVYVVVLWLGTVLGLAGTMWD